MANNNCKLLETIQIPYRKWQLDNWYKLQSVYPSISHDNLQKYIHAIMSAPSITYTESGFTNIDISSKYINVLAGIRQSVKSTAPGMGDQNKSNIYMFGDSRMYGMGVQDEDTLPSKLQQLCNMSAMPVNILNYGVRSDILLNIYSKIKNLKFTPNDAIVLFMPVYSSYLFTEKVASRYCYWPILSEIINYMASVGIPLYVFKFPDIRRLKNPSQLERRLQYSLSVRKKRVLICPDYVYSDCQPVPYYDTQASLTKIPERYSSFWDYYHLGPLGHAAVAQFVFQVIKDKLFNDGIDGKRIAIDEEKRGRVEQLLGSFVSNCAANYEIQNKSNYRNAILSYKKYPRFAANPSDIIGSIVMNCNPLSNGHIYLINEALKHVDFLYIFIVNEDKSFFSFDHRLFMVRKYFANYNNVRVLPSGSLMISDLTFPDYFQKDYNKDKEINAGLDIHFFCNVISKMFNITKRFIGTEPYCQITNQYNSILRKALPKYGIDCIEIDRKLHAGQPISASLIRSYIKNNDLDSIKALVPPITYDVIKHYYVNIP